MPSRNNPIPSFVLNRLREDEAQAVATPGSVAAAAAAAAAAGIDTIIACSEHTAELMVTEKKTFFKNAV